jgi:hypothetical protein
MKPEIGDHVGNVLNAVVRLSEAQEELIVHCIVKVPIEPITFVKYTASKEGRRRRDVQNSVVEQYEGIESDLATDSDDGSILIHDGEVPIENIDVRIFREGFDDVFEAAWTIPVVGVQPPDNVSFGLRESSIKCVALTSVGTGHPSDMRPLPVSIEGLKHGDRLIG